MCIRGHALEILSFLVLAAGCAAAIPRDFGARVPEPAQRDRALPTVPTPSINGMKVAASAHVTWTPPPRLLPASVPKATIPTVLVANISVGTTAIKLESTLLSDVGKELGARVGHTGDASDSAGWICASGTGSAGRWALWLTTWELEGGRVSGLRWQRFPSNSTVDQRCAELPRERQIELPHHLRLGISRTDVIASLGTPTLETKGSLLFVHENKLAIKGDHYTVDETVAIRLQHGRVSAIEVEKTTQD